MDLRNFESTSTYAIEAVYRDYWFAIPERYRLFEKANRQPDVPKSVQPVLKYADVEAQDNTKPLPDGDDFYFDYCNLLNNKELQFDLQPFFDPQLDFENRIHQKLVGINYPNRKHPWFIMTWNCATGLLKSTTQNRLFGTSTIKNMAGELVKFDFINSEMDITICFTSNSLQALFELQEFVRVSRREKAVVYTRKHSVLGPFPVSLNLIDSQISKMDRSKGTLCTMSMIVKIDFPIIGNVRPADEGVIREIHADANEYPNEHAVQMTTDIIDENTTF